MEYDNKAYGAALKLARQKAKLKIGDIAQAFGVDEVYFSAVENGQEPSQKFVENALLKLCVSYAAFQRPTANNLPEAADMMMKDNVLPFPYRYRAQDDV